MNHLFGFAIEIFVAVLLVLTILYCRVLNARLTRLKSDEQSLKATIAELITATEIAERAIGGLKHTVRDVNDNLGHQITTANELTQHLHLQLMDGEKLIQRLSRITGAARQQPEPQAQRAPSAKAIVAAAQAFSDRRRADGLAA